MAKLHRKTKIIALLLIFTLSLFQISETALAASILPSDTNKAGSGNILVGVSGSFERVSKTKILKRINEIRKEACNKGYINPSTGKKNLKVPIMYPSNGPLILNGLHSYGLQNALSMRAIPVQMGRVVLAFFTKMSRAGRKIWPGIIPA